MEYFRLDTESHRGRAVYSRSGDHEDSTCEVQLHLLEGSVVDVLDDDVQRVSLHARLVLDCRKQGTGLATLYRLRYHAQPLTLHSVERFVSGRGTQLSHPDQPRLLTPRHVAERQYM